MKLGQRPMSSAFIAAEIAAALMKQPLTLYELAQVVGLEKRHLHTPKRYVDQFHEAGCVRIAGVSPRGALRYRWQSTLFAEPDYFDQIITKERNE